MIFLNEKTVYMFTQRNTVLNISKKTYQARKQKTSCFSTEERLKNTIYFLFTALSGRGILRPL